MGKKFLKGPFRPEWSFKQIQPFSYRVTLQAKPPSNALIEGVIAHNLETDQWLPTGEIERNNKYGNTSHCVIDRFNFFSDSPFSFQKFFRTLKKICHCSRRT